MAITQRDTNYYTYKDYLTWPNDNHDELINGTAYVREPPAPTLTHQELVGQLHYQICAALEDKLCRVYVAPVDVRLPKSDEPDDEIDTVVQPDVLIVCDRNKIDDRGVRGAPDWLAEVLSPSTASHDLIRKIPAYERAGVREAWLVYPTDRTLAIYLLKDGHYGRATVQDLKGKTTLAAVPGVTIDWDRMLSRIA